MQYSDNVYLIGNSGNSDIAVLMFRKTERNCKHWKGGVLNCSLKKTIKDQEYDRRGIIGHACRRDSMEPLANRDDSIKRCIPFIIRIIREYARIHKRHELRRCITDNSEQHDSVI